jgi:hypothetical protein
MSKYWNDLLRTEYKKRAPEDERNRQVRLPAEGISFDGDAGHARIKLQATQNVGGKLIPGAAFRNMQDNAAAFEGWSLVLHHWCGAKKVSLEWEQPEPPPEPEGPMSTDQRHYQRFLYRAQRFHSLFPDWFEIAGADPFIHSRVGSGRPVYLNLAGKRSEVGPTKVGASPEYVLECRLVTDPNFRAHYGFSVPVIDRQFPVGLFSTQRPKLASALFPGGKGAIDLVSLDNHHLWLFELKAKGNISVGTLSELLFYASVARDVAMKEIGFNPEGGGHAKVNAKDLADVKAITGVMLGHQLHPLLTDPALLSLINTAVQARWNVGNAPPVDFRADRITSNYAIDDSTDELRIAPRYINPRTH